MQGLKGDIKILSNLNFFLVRCLGMVIAYILNRTTNLIIHACNQNLYKEYFFIIFISIYLGSYILSIIFYLLLECLVASTIKHMENDKQNKKEFYKICGYLLYYEKNPSN